MAEWATAEDVTDRWVGDDKPTDTDLIEQLVADAEEVIVWEYPDIADRVVDSDGSPSEDEPDNPLPEERLVMVICRMVTRVLRNPDGSRQVSETQGPFTRYRSFDRERAGEMGLTDQERRMLGYTPGAPGQKAFTIPLGGDEEPTGYLGGSDAW